jgi:prepilin-type N-terminal cleavage/methylation domain-containing protein
MPSTSRLPNQPSLRRRGLTAVEVVVAATLLGILVTAGYYLVLRQQQAQREAEWQAALDEERSALIMRLETEPHKVFDFYARPLKETFAPHENIYILCDVTNPTRHDLLFRTHEFFLQFGHGGVPLQSARLDRVDGDPVENKAVFDGVLSTELFTPIEAQSTAQFILALEPKVLKHLLGTEDLTAPLGVDVAVYIARTWGGQFGYHYPRHPYPPEEFPRITLRIAPETPQ